MNKRLPSQKTAIDNLQERMEVRICSDGIRRNTLRPLTSEEIHERFFKRIQIDEKTQCWNWIGANCGSSCSYGTMINGGKMVKSHRYAYEKFKGAIPDGLIVRHRCDNSLCCNPEHLEVGTHKDNAQDSIKRGRARYGIHYGEKNPKSVLTRDHVIRIIALKKEGLTQKEISTRLRIKITTIGAVQEGRTWGHLTGIPHPSSRKRGEHYFEGVPLVQA